MAWTEFKWLWTGPQADFYKWRPRDYVLLRDLICTLGVANFIVGWHISHTIFSLNHSSVYEKHKLMTTATNLVRHIHPHLLIAPLPVPVCLSVSLTTSMLIESAYRMTPTGLVQLSLTSYHHHHYPFHSMPLFLVILCFKTLWNACRGWLTSIFLFVPQNISVAKFQANNFPVSHVSACVIFT